VKEVRDVDTSTIISSGTLKREGFLPRLTTEVLAEVIRHGIPASSGTFLEDGKTPGYIDFTSVFSNSIVSQYEYTSGMRRFFIEKFAPGKSSYLSLCGNKHHSAIFVVHDTVSGKNYGVCEGVLGDPGDFSLVKQYIFYPDEHTQFEAPKDKCLGRTLKNISQINHE